MKAKVMTVHFEGCYLKSINTLNRKTLLFDDSISKTVQPITVDVICLYSFKDDQIEFVVISIEFLIVLCVN